LCRIVETFITTNHNVSIIKSAATSVALLALSVPAVAGGLGSSTAISTRDAASVRNVLDGHSVTTVDRYSEVEWEGHTSSGSVNFSADLDVTGSTGAITDVDVVAVLDSASAGGGGLFGGLQDQAASGFGEVRTGHFANLNGVTNVSLGYQFETLDAEGYEETTISSRTSEDYTESTASQSSDRIFRNGADF